MTEHRLVRHAEVRATGAPGLFEAIVMRYGVVDDYGTVFDARCFRSSLEKRLPRITWGHEWTEMIGHAVDYKDTEDTLTVVAQLDDFDAVPRARQAYAQLQSGTVTEFSVGFRRGQTYEDPDGHTHFSAGTILDEVALVITGAVPGTELLSVRSARSRVDAALARAGRTPLQRPTPRTTEPHEEWLRREWRAGRLTRSQYEEDLRLTREADEALHRLGIS